MNTAPSILATAVAAPPLLRLTVPGVRLEAATPTDPARARTITGLAVPYDVVATVESGQTVRFAPGSLPLDGPAPRVLLHHDRTQGIGVVTERTDGPDGVHIAARISAVPAGDHALILAADGVLDSWSVGVEPLEWTTDPDGTMNVTAGEWREVSLLTFGAFPQARVATVTAADPPAAPPAPADPVATVPSLPAVAAGPALPVSTPTVVPVSTGPPDPGRGVTLSGLARLVAAANRGEIEPSQARARIAAALTNVTTTGIGAVVMPAYRAEIVGLIDHGRPMITALGRTDLPASGMTIEYPKWTTLPTVGQQATEKTAITSTAATMGLGTANVVTFAGGNDVSLQSVERSSPSFLEAYLRAMAVDYARKTDTYVADALIAAAGTPLAGTGELTDDLATLLGALDLTAVPPGPLFVALAWDIAVNMIPVKSVNGPAYWSGSINFGSVVPTTSADGLTMFVDPYLAAGRMVLGARNGATWYENASAPADVRVIDVSLLGMDVGVYGYGAVSVEYPGAFKVLDVPAGP